MSKKDKKTPDIFIPTEPVTVTDFMSTVSDDDLLPFAEGMFPSIDFTAPDAPPDYAAGWFTVYARSFAERLGKDYRTIRTMDDLTNALAECVAMDIIGRVKK